MNYLVYFRFFGMVTAAHVMCYRSHGVLDSFQVVVKVSSQNVNDLNERSFNFIYILDIVIQLEASSRCTTVLKVWFYALLNSCATPPDLPQGKFKVLFEKFIILILIFFRFARSCFKCSFLLNIPQPL